MMKKILLIVLALIVLVGGSVGGTLFLTGALPGAKGHDAPPAEPVRQLPIYLTLDPAFVVNIDDGAAVRFLQVEINLMFHDTAVGERLGKVMPRVRNDLIMLLSSVQREAVRSTDGRAQLQQQALAVVNRVLKEETGKAGVEAVYFTKFVVQ